MPAPDEANRAPLDPAFSAEDAAKLKAFQATVSRLEAARQTLLGGGMANPPPDLDAYNQHLRVVMGKNAERWFRFHGPMGNTGARLDSIRASCHSLALALIHHGEPSWELNHALETLRTAMFWAVASVVCNQADQEGEAAMNAFVEDQKGKATSEPPTSGGAAAAGSSPPSSPP